MSQVAIVTASCARISEDFLGQLNIHVVADYIHREREVLCDLVTMQPAEFLRRSFTLVRVPAAYVSILLKGSGS
jgi:fatty acid-binding protein DegV